MATKYPTTPLLQAALSHFESQRDKCLADLDIALNNKGSVHHNSESVIQLFRELAEADIIIDKIEAVIVSNQPAQYIPVSTEPITEQSPA